MYYIRISQYGQVAFGTMGYTNLLKLDRNRANGTGLCSVLRFDTYDSAVEEALSLSEKQNYYGKTTYHVADIDDPFVQQWLIDNEGRYCYDNGKIIPIHN